MIKKGDTVRITLPHGWWAEGTVISLEIWGDKLFSVDLNKTRIAWELPHTIQNGYGYGRWKATDGGTVHKIKGSNFIQQEIFHADS